MKEVIIELPPAIEKQAREILNRGYIFEIEVLTTDEVSATIVDKIAEVDAAIKIGPNNATIPETIGTMIAGFHRRMITEDLHPGEMGDV